MRIPDQFGQKPLCFRYIVTGDGFQNAERFGMSFPVIGRIGGQNQFCQCEAGVHAALAKGRPVPGFQHGPVGKSLDSAERKMFADQKHGIGIALCSGTAKPVQCRRQAFRQAFAAE